MDQKNNYASSPNETWHCLQIYLTVKLHDGSWRITAKYHLVVINEKLRTQINLAIIMHVDTVISKTDSATLESTDGAQ